MAVNALDKLQFLSFICLVVDTVPLAKHTTDAMYVKVSAFSFNACTKTCAPLPDCFINNALIHFVPNCQDTYTQFFNVLDPVLVDLLLHYRPHFVVNPIYIQALGGMKSGVSILSSSTVS